MNITKGIAKLCDKKCVWMEIEWQFENQVIDFKTNSLVYRLR